MTSGAGRLCRAGTVTSGEDIRGRQVHRRGNRRFGELEGEWTDELRAAGVPVRCRLEEGGSVTALLRVAEDEGADLVVVGSRGSGGFSELLGSTSHQVALYADRPVTIVPPPGRPRPLG